MSEPVPTTKPDEPFLRPGGSDRRPGLTVAILAYHSELTLPRALKSVATSFDHVKNDWGSLELELLVVFDGPDPKTESQTNDFRHTAAFTVTKVVRPHSGIPATRNAAVAHTSTSHITFLDADDELTPHRFVQAMRMSDQVLCGTQKVVFDSYRARNLHILGGETGQPHFTSSVLPVDTILSVGGFENSLALSEDIDLTIRLRHAGHDLLFEKEVTVVRHLTGKNASVDIEQGKSGIFKSLHGRLMAHREGQQNV